MIKYSIELTDKQIKNIGAFLNRVEYKGVDEAIAVVEIIDVIEKSMVESKK